MSGSDRSVLRRCSECEILLYEGENVELSDGTYCEDCAAHKEEEPLATDGGEADGGNHVGPIVFADETARSQLVDEREVVTFRASQRTTGETWWRKSRTGTKCGDVTVEEIGAVDPRDDDALKPYRELSGFTSIEAWRDAMRELNGGVPSEGYLFRVTASQEKVAADGGKGEADAGRWTCPECDEEWDSIDRKLPGGCVGCVDNLRYLEYEAPGMAMVHNDVAAVVCFNHDCSETIAVDPETLVPEDEGAVDIESEVYDMEAGEATGRSRVEIYCTQDCQTEQYTPDGEVATDGGQTPDDQKEAHRLGTINKWDAPDDEWTTEFDWTRSRGPAAYPVPGGWVLGMVEADGTGWHYYGAAGVDEWTDTDLDPDDREADAMLLIDVADEDAGLREDSDMEWSLSVGGTDVFRRVEPDREDAYAAVARALRAYHDGDLDDAEIVPSSGRKPDDVREEEAVERKQEANESLDRFVTDGGREQDGEDTVRLTWWSASGLQERNIPFESIDSVELNDTSGSKNPFSVRVDGEWSPQYCRSIEWPENRGLPVGVEHSDETLVTDGGRPEDADRDGVSFDCPECDHDASYRTRFTGALGVFWHFFTAHPEESVAWGDPRTDAEPPAFESPGDGRDDSKEVRPDGGHRPPCDAAANVDPTPPTEEGFNLERRVCPNCRLYFDTAADSDLVFCSDACRQRHERGELIADGGEETEPTAETPADLSPEEAAFGHVGPRRNAGDLSPEEAAFGHVGSQRNVVDQDGDSDE